MQSGNLDVADFAASFGISADRLPASCVQRINKNDFSYRRPDGAERDGIVLEVLKRLEADSQKIGAPGRQAVWERGWREALDEHVGSNFTPCKLEPFWIEITHNLRD